MTSLHSQEGEVICPSCGQWVVWLHESSGFCIECADIEPFCTQCGNEYVPDEFTKDICSYCKTENWLRKNADAIEANMKDGLTFYQSKLKVFNEVRPICLCCGKPIKGAKQDALFCTKTPQCKTARRRFRTLREKHGKPVALIQIQMELKGLTLIK